MGDNPPMTDGTGATDEAAGVWRDLGLRMAGFGHYFPSDLVTNPENVAAVPGSSADDKILGRVGTRSRHRASDEETPLVMAIGAATDALATAGIAASDVDLVLLSNWTERVFRPEMAPLVAASVGADRAVGFDISGGCAGFVLGVHTAASFLAAPTHHRTALVVSTERFSRRIRPGSRGELIAGDGAGAAVLVRDQRPAAADGPGLLDSMIYCNGHLSDLTATLPPHGWVRSKPELVEQAIGDLTTMARTLLDRNGFKVADVDWLVPHSGTMPIVTGLRECLGVAPERLLTNFQIRGNLSSASVPCVLSEYTRSGRVRPGDLILTPVVGGGWFYGGMLVRL